MKKVLVIGSTVADVIITLDHLPKTQEDVHVIRQTMSLGGCAYNTSDMIRHFQIPYILFSPVGQGAYGDFVRAGLEERGIRSPIPSPDSANGCCYCFVEKGGERTFISYHGAEYRFEKEWFSLLNTEEIDSVYVCGLEIEEPTGENIVSWLETQPCLTLYFAPGPRILRIDERLLDRIFALHPVLHLNEEEAVRFTENHLQRTRAEQPGMEPVPPDDADAPTGIEFCAEYLHRLTGSAVIITLGSRGSYCFSEEGACFTESVPAVQADTIGAGDSHIGAVIACRKLGMSWSSAVRSANIVAAKVVGTKGALLPDEDFAAIRDILL